MSQVAILLKIDILHTTEPNICHIGVHESLTNVWKVFWRSVFSSSLPIIITQESYHVPMFRETIQKSHSFKNRMEKQPHETNSYCVYMERCADLVHPALPL